MRRSLVALLSFGLGVLFVAPTAYANPFKDFGHAVKDGAKATGQALKDGGHTFKTDMKGTFKGGGATTRSGARAGGRHSGGGGKSHRGGGGRHHRYGR